MCIIGWKGIECNAEKDAIGRTGDADTVAVVEHERGVGGVDGEVVGISNC